MNWDTLYAEMLGLLAAKSKDPDSQYACILVDEENRILSTGYNGIPRGMDYKDEYTKRPDKYMYFIHAEANAVFNAAAIGVALDGCTAHVIKPPCVECLKTLYQSGIREIVFSVGHSIVGENVDPTDWRFTLATAKEMGSRMHDLSIRQANIQL